MPLRCQPGDTVFLNDDGGGHRWVVITKPNKDGCVVMVNFTDAASCPDRTVLFTRRSDKNIFDKPTRVHYIYAEIIKTDILIKRANSKGIVSDYKPCKETILSEIIDGAFKSDFTTYEILEELGIHYPEKFNHYYPNGLEI